MYLRGWIEHLRARPRGDGAARRFTAVGPVVWALGLTSLLTDISSEMINSILPVYLVLHLRLSPLQYGAVDGLYNGFAALLAGVFAGWLADRGHRQKQVAAAGYGLSAICKPLMLAAGGVWGWIVLITGLDRLGKSIRTAPRDALISLNSPQRYLASAFGVHRAMDAAGALLGPLIAFALLSRLPGDFDTLWWVSFIFACLGVGALWLLVPGAGARSHLQPGPRPQPSAASVAASRVLTPGFAGLAGCAALLAAVTVSDGFIYLLLQRQAGTSATTLPLFYVLTAAAYMVFAFPAGRVADRVGRVPVLLAGYAMLMAVYAALLFAPMHHPAVAIVCLLTLGLYYAGTEGILVSLASAIVPAEHRATGLALMGACIGAGKLFSSALFGWLWQAQGTVVSLVVYGAGLALAATTTLAVLHAHRHV